MEMESLRKFKSAIEKNLDELMNKSDLSPAETKTALDAFKLRNIILCEIEKCRMEEEYSERGRSYREYSGEPMNQSYRRYSNTAYGQYENRGMGYGGYQNTGYQNNGDWSGRRSYCGMESYDSGYSRHSIGDRVIEKMEKLMDQAESEYEREELRKFMKMIRQAAD